MKKFFAVLLAVGVLFGSQSFVYAVPCPIRGSNYTYETWTSLGSLRIRQTFVIKNVSNHEVYLRMDDFVLRKAGFNTVKPGHFGGGFSSSLNPPMYTESSYELYPGDVIGVSLDYDTGDKTAIGWKLCYTNYGNMVVLASINE